jgi:hypothetical protein
MAKPCQPVTTHQVRIIHYHWLDAAWRALKDLPAPIMTISASSIAATFSKTMAMVEAAVESDD